MLSFTIGMVLGVIQIGALTARTIEVMKGNPWAVFIIAIPLNVTHYMSTTMIVDKNMEGFVGFAVGATLVTFWMAHRNKKPEVANAHKEDVGDSGVP